MGSWSELHILNRALEAAPLVPFACAWVRRHHIPYALKPVYYYVGIKAFLYFLDTFSRLVFRNNVYIYHLTTVLLVGLLALTYYRLLPLRFKPLIKAGLLLFALVAVLDAWLLNGLFTDVNSYSQAFGCALLVLLAILHVIYLTNTASEQALENQPEFFLSVAVLAYCSCSIVSYVAINLVYHMGYDRATIIRLDTLISGPETFLMAVQMGLLAWMFRFFPLSISPTHALPLWLHYSHWHPRPFLLLGQSLGKLGLQKPEKTPI
jgi:hypothetical protein